MKEMLRTAEQDEQNENVKIMKKAAQVDVKGGTTEFKMNAGVPTLDPSESEAAGKEEVQRWRPKNRYATRQGCRERPALSYGE